MKKEILLPNKMVLSMRTAKEADAESLISYLKRVGDETNFLTFSGADLNLTIDEEIEFIRQSFGEEGNVFLLGVIAGEIVGVLTIIRGSKPRLQRIGELGVTVLKKYWRLGIGKLLVHEGLKFALEKGIVKINLSVNINNVAAILLYLSLGFEIEGKIKKAVCIENTFYDELLLGMDLTKA
ncbi:GNAT family N-acetyltransferase [Legionella sp. 27cVA30]|uniref:GNAT family N-acetyltransferase n=1 Tax=Legionella septentrionalis TaxID=2498109 RepID=A0A3S0XGD8_9GAMM|nr:MULTISPECIES: GNAT family N-acetyltransferase [Legionella]MCP0913708.1 GNAT family N-acetyltransferase [Legionella sp. 27cVA30]RUQ88238.1 GNAT family N-acetyltransferase [Legionella septentrionalis]RUR15932.1 GNAT family N-acetyltransferase [Legionella septentrionalis]